MITICEAVRILGEQYESAIEAMWETSSLDEEVHMNVFLVKWTEWIEATTHVSIGDELK